MNDQDKPIITSFTQRELEAISGCLLAIGAHDKLMSKINRVLHWVKHNNPRATVSVPDVSDDTKSGQITVEQESRGVGIRFTGYGDLTSTDGFGIPVLVEYREGIPHVVVWADINQEDPTHVISLEGAAESKRGSEPCEECGNDIPVIDSGGLANKHHKSSCSLYDSSAD